MTGSCSPSSYTITLLASCVHLLSFSRQHYSSDSSLILPPSSSRPSIMVRINWTPTIERYHTKTGKRVLLMAMREYTWLELLIVILTYPILFYRSLSLGMSENAANGPDPTFVVPSGPLTAEGKTAVKKRS
ncbi:hypothetical protein BD324DRAFT_622418 [Kockovaella imperatae]|uniref:Uncharacterized protein n=1 Tax=Kockovaella imperatae TaxID=4999 RepID=A0A1Y1UHR1_9TREE|nr:hypothetical protein BD324DRAFT_622418 [Kockovaella imperatae]ORX37562.1 hypothetical protein BD324DRAFT_622418 [Kockovaella imperatae]